MRIFLLGLLVIAACSRSSELDTHEHIELQMSCGKGDTSACDRVSRADREACDKGDGPACTLRGITYQVGRSEPKDAAAALTYFEKACAYGDGAGCWYAGACYEYGRGTSVDAARALEKYELACAKSFDNGCVSLGGAYERASPPDPAKAKAAYAKACSLGARSVCGR